MLLSPFLRAVPIPAGRGHLVVVFPGYLTSDVSSIRLRRSLGAAGYVVRGWGMGQNRGLRPGLLKDVEERLALLHDRYGQPAVLIGWSLGGLFAREVAKMCPDLVRLVITLGSPFSGNPRANNAWRPYELLNDHPVDKLPIDTNLSEKPMARTIAVHSPIDGIVAQSAARGLAGESDRQVELIERHLSLARSPAGIRLIGQLLAEEL